LYFLVKNIFENFTNYIFDIIYGKNETINKNRAKYLLDLIFTDNLINKCQLYQFIREYIELYSHELIEYINNVDIKEVKKHDGILDTLFKNIHTLYEDILFAVKGVNIDCNYLIENCDCNTFDFCDCESRSNVFVYSVNSYFKELINPKCLDLIIDYFGAGRLELVIDYKAISNDSTRKYLKSEFQKDLNILRQYKDKFLLISIINLERHVIIFDDDIKKMIDELLH